MAAALLCLTLSAAAQSGGEKRDFPGPPGGEKPKEMSVAQLAQLKVDQMAAELPLTEKQVKKLYNYYKNDFEYRRNNLPGGDGPRPDFAGGRPPQGGPGGRPPQGMGGPGGFPGGGFPGGGPGMGPGGRPPFPDGEIDPEELERYNQKQEKKLKKILGEDLYAQWRAAHPQEAPKLPDLPAFENQ